MSRGLVASLFIGIAIIAAGYWLSPRISLHVLEGGLRNGDVAVLERYVEWARVRDGLKGDLLEVLGGNPLAAKSDAGGAFSGFMGAALVGVLIDTIVTPQSVALNSRSLSDMVVDGQWFEKLDEYRVRVAGADASKPPVTLVLERRGIDWHVVRIMLPLDVLRDFAGDRSGAQRRMRSTAVPPQSDRAARPDGSIRRDTGAGARSFRDCDGCPEMIVIPAGEFTMGSLESESGRYEREGPTRRVVVRAPLAVGKYPVTRREFARFVADTGMEPTPGCFVWDGSELAEDPRRTWRDPGFEQADDHPVLCVSWHDAKAYVAWLSDRTGRPYRLLRETEWEYAARAGTSTPRWWGEGKEDQCGYANGFDRSARTGLPGGSRLEAAECDDGFVHTSPVGSFRPNAFGLYDMAGNVYQWLDDCALVKYGSAPVDSGASVSYPNCETHVARGGSWLAGPKFLRAAYRARYDEHRRSAGLGFRVARAPDG